MCLSETKWIMSTTVAMTMLLMSVGHVALSLYLMRRIGVIEVGKSCIDIDDDYKDFNLEERTLDDDKLAGFTVKKVIKGLVHNLDMISDWLYFFTVPSYCLCIKVTLILSMVIPFMVILLYAKDFKLSWLATFALFTGFLPLYKVHVDKERQQ